MSGLIEFVRGRLEDNPDGPRSAVLARALEQAIRAGVVSAGDALPAERGLCEALGLSRTTLRRAFEILDDAGLLDRRLGAGTFVAPRAAQPVSRLRSFTEDMESRGMTASSRVLRLERGAVSPDEAFQLGVSPLIQVLHLDRIRLADCEPMSIEHVVVPAAAVPSDYDGTSSLYAAMAATGSRPVRMIQRLCAEVATAVQGSQLGIAAGAALLAIERVSYAGDGRAVEFARSLYRGDRYYTVAELSA